MVLSTDEFGEYVDKGCPMVLGGPMPHVMAAKAVAFTEAAAPEFKTYARAIVDNASALASACIDNGMDILTGGTDNHLMLANIAPYGLTGRQAESGRTARPNVTLNRNSIPFDPNGAWYTSGLRFGTPALTSRGMGETEMTEIASIMASVLSATTAPPHHQGQTRRTAQQSPRHHRRRNRRDRPRPRPRPPLRLPPLPPTSTSTTSSGRSPSAKP